VVTGTLWSGELEVGETVEVLPSGAELRIRSIQVHDQPRERVDAGQRVALNLAGPGRDGISRGDVVCSTGAGLRATYRLDVRLQSPVNLGEEDRRVQIHHGTRQTPARVVPLDDEGLAQLRLESPLVARAGDRFVVRRIASPETLGGGAVIDPSPARHGPGPARKRLDLMEAASPAEVLTAALLEGAGPTTSVPVAVDPARWDLHPLLGPARRRFSPEDCRRAVMDLLDRGSAVEHNGRLIRPAEVEEPPAPPPPDDRALHALELIGSDGVAPRSPAALAEELDCERAEALSSLGSLVAAGRAVRVKPGIYYESSVLEELRARLLDAAVEGGGEIALPDVKALLGTSRKYAQALLEHLDSLQLTGRHGDRHVLRRAARIERGEEGGFSLVGRQGSGGPPGPQSQ
jgi:selenocysteine-specific elongation factor